MTIEELLRESFTTQVADQPPLHAPAERAIRTARAVRRRRTVVSLLASVVAVLVAGAGVAAAPAGHSPGPSPGPSPAPSVSRAPVRLALTMLAPRIGLVMADGRTVDLTAYAPYQAYAVPAGTMVLGQNTGSWLLLVTPGGSVNVLLQGAGGIVVARDGVHVAWVKDDKMYTGHLDGGWLTIDHGTPASTEGFPIAMTDSAVILGGTQTGGGIDRFDVWLPASGDYVAHWDRTPAKVSSVVGTTPDGRLLGTVVGSADQKELCLAVLDPANHLTATRTACGVDLLVSATGRVSPDGHWLALTTMSATDDRGNTALVDLTTVFTEPTILREWSYPMGYWLDPTTMVARDENGAVRLRVAQDRSEPVDVTVLTPGSSYDWVPPPDGLAHPAG